MIVLFFNCSVFYEPMTTFNLTGPRESQTCSRNLQMRMYVIFLEAFLLGPSVFLSQARGSLSLLSGFLFPGS